MDRSKENNYAFIDSQNLNLSIRALGWALDFKRFRKYLLEKYSISEAFLFIGFVEGNNDLYKSLQEAGFICIFKPTLKYKDGTTKGKPKMDQKIENLEKEIEAIKERNYILLALIIFYSAR